MRRAGWLSGSGRANVLVLAAWMALIVCLLGFWFVRRITWEHSERYTNGQFRVLPGKEDNQGQWDGPWFFLNPDGSIMYEETFDGKAFSRTGFYSHGMKVRDLTEPEIQNERQRIAKYLKKIGLDR